MLELLAAVIALTFQGLFELFLFIVSDVPRWLFNLASETAEDDTEPRVYESEAIASLMARGIPEERARDAAHKVFSHAAIMEDLMETGVPKAEARRIATLATKGK